MSFRRILTAAQVLTIRAECAPGSATHGYTAFASSYGVNRTAVTRAYEGLTFKELGRPTQPMPSDAEVERLWREGLSDAEIGRVWGVSGNPVRTIRRGLGLTAADRPVHARPRRLSATRVVVRQAPTQAEPRA